MQTNRTPGPGRGIPADQLVQDAAQRATRTIHALQQLWGEGMPATGDPVHVVMTDAIYSDDERGRDRGLIVQGDGLTVHVLQQLLRAKGPLQEQMLLLPPHLAQRLAGRVVESSLPQVQEETPSPQASDPSPT